MTVSKIALLTAFTCGLFICGPQALQAAGEKEKRPVTVTSDTMEANKADGTVVFKGRVAAVEDFTLCSDALTIRYGEERDVSFIEASGNVRIFHGNRVSTSEKAVYDKKERMITLTGQPVLKQCTDTVKGERITVYLDKDNAVVDGGNGRVRAVIMPDKKCPEGASGGKTEGEEARCGGAR